MNATVEIPDPPFAAGMVVRIPWPAGGQLIAHILSVSAHGGWRYLDGRLLAWPDLPEAGSTRPQPGPWDFTLVAQAGSTRGGRPYTPCRPGQVLVLSDVNLRGAEVLPNYGPVVGPDDAGEGVARADGSAKPEESKP